MKTLMEITGKRRTLIEETYFQGAHALAIRNVADTVLDIPRLLSKAYGDISAFIKRNGIEEGKKVMCFYNTIDRPFDFEAAIEVEHLSSKISGKIYDKEIRPCKVVVAHFWGPYDQLKVAYNELMKWVKSNKKRVAGNMFEVYVNDPATVQDPYEVQTDIYQPVE